MTKPKPPEDLADLYADGVLPPVPPEPPMTYRKRWPMWTLVYLGGPGRSWDEAGRLDDELQDRWEAENLAEHDARAQARADQAERRKLDLAERRLRVNDRLRRLRAREQREGSS